MKIQLPLAALLVLSAAFPLPALAQATATSESTNLEATSSEPTSAPVLEPPVRQDPAAGTVPRTIVAPPAPSTSFLGNQDYLLGPGDSVNISVFEYEEFTGEKVVLSDGTIVLPLIGTVMAAGRTPDQLERYLETQLKTYLVNPVVTVTLTTLRPVTVNVAGEVQRPGPVRLRSLTTTTGNNLNETTPTLATALVQAGGVTRYADIREVILRRTNPDGSANLVTVNLWDALTSENAPPDLVLQDGDSIYIPRLAADATLDRRLIARSSFAPATVRVRVVGEVVRPGEVATPPNSSISSAVAIAGGPTEDARLSRVQFIRMNEQGQIEQRELDLRNLNDEFQVQEGDVVIVPKRNSSTILDLAARILNPFSSLVNVLDDLGNLGGNN